MSYFPMFVELKNRPCLVVGGGKVAYRKVLVLKDFGAEVTVIAPEILPQIREEEGVHCEERSFEQADLQLPELALVIAATDDPQTNHHIAAWCQEQKLPVNAVDQIADCSFIVPAYVKQQEVVAAFSSGGSSPVIAQYLKEQIRPVMTEQLGELAACLKGIRDEVKRCVPTEKQRKEVYLELLELGLQEERIPTAEEIQSRLYRYRGDEA